MAQFVESERRDGTRFSWNVLPNNRIEATRMAVPMGCLYTPLKQIPELVQVPYAPITCKTAGCGAVLNPWCRVDFNNKIFLCPICGNRNNFPPNFCFSAENRPSEMLPQCTTIEYLLDDPNRPPQAPVFLFVVDTCISEEELTHLKGAIQQTIMYMPENALIGLITFGKNVHVHELQFDEIPKSFVFRGSKELSSDQVSLMLGLRPTMPTIAAAPVGGRPGVGMMPQQPAAVQQRFLCPVSECDMQLQSILDELSKDCWHYKDSERPQRCTGTAIAVAVGLLETTFRERSARIMTFLGGPPTVGAGAVVSTDAKEIMRSHTDLAKHSAPHVKKATEFYTALANRAATNGHVIDIFACSLDQIGLLEMKPLIERTGGLFVQDDSFVKEERDENAEEDNRSGLFVDSLPKVFAADLNNELAMCFSGEMTVLTSRELKVAGAIGHVASSEKKSAHVADTEIGVGGTAQWSLGGLDPNTTVGVYFTLSQLSDSQQNVDSRQAYVQFVTKYKHSSGRTHLRVTTVAKTFADAKSLEGMAYLRAGFDQEAATVLIARQAVYRAQTENVNDVTRWVDRHLISLVSKFGRYQPGEPNSFSLTTEFEFYPQFMFYLRRSQFIQVFNSSPDETAFCRTLLLRENVTNTLVMIQPTLTAYSMDGPAVPVNLDVSATSPERILVLDTFFNLVIWYGDKVAKWRAQKLQDMPEYDYFAQFLAAPKVEAEVHCVLSLEASSSSYRIVFGPEPIP